MLVRERLLSVSALSLLELALAELELELELAFDLERGGVEAAWDKMFNPAEVETGPFGCAFGCALSLPLPLPLPFVGCLPPSRETSCSSSSSSLKSMQGKRVCQAQTKQRQTTKQTLASVIVAALPFRHPHSLLDVSCPVCVLLIRDLLSLGYE